MGGSTTFLDSFHMHLKPPPNFGDASLPKTHMPPSSGPGVEDDHFLLGWVILFTETSGEQAFRPQNDQTEFASKVESKWHHLNTHIP